jgi:hypothetical protein
MLAELHMEKSHATTQLELRKGAIPSEVRAQLIEVAQRVFWWGDAEKWVQDMWRFAAQVMTFGNFDDVRLTLQLLGDKTFVDALKSAPAGVFDPKSWTFWHAYYRLPLPPLPERKL